MTRHINHLLSLFDPGGRDVIDIGAGTGAFAEELANATARVIGIEVDGKKVAAANNGRPFEMREGRGENLPVPDGSQDLACFMFSFHHIPDALQSNALCEASRVLRADGRLHVVDPRPYGAMTEIVRFVEDETEVRTKSQLRLDALSASDGFELLSKSEYLLERHYSDFEALVRHVVFVDPERSARLPAVEADMRREFEARSEQTSGDYKLEQPCVAYHFRKIEK